MSHLPVILLGAGGHAKVVLDILLAHEISIIGVCDPVLAEKRIKKWRGLPVLGVDNAVMDYSANKIKLANGIGSLPGNNLRKRLHEKFSLKGYQFSTLVHPSAIVGTGVELGQGVQLMAGCIVQADTKIGINSILNTAVSVDHDVNIGLHVHIAPGAVLSGGVNIGNDAHIGPGAVVIQGVSVGESSVVGAGTTIIKNIPAFHQQIGQPPRQPYGLAFKEIDTEK